MGSGFHLTQRNHFGFRRVTEPGVRTALVDHRQGRAFGRLGDGHRQVQLLAINLALAIKLIVMRLAERQLWRGDLRLLRSEFDLLAIEVIALFHLPVQLEFIFLLLEIKHKGLIGRNKTGPSGGVK